jgi:hypothetical protein
MNTETGKTWKKNKKELRVRRRKRTERKILFVKKNINSLNIHVTPFC